MAFHEVRFPASISLGAKGGPERRTDIVTLGSGFEERNARWADSRRAWDAGYGIKSLDNLHALIAFFEERRGRLHGFRWRDHGDCKSCAPQGSPSATDQVIGVGDGTVTTFQLKKTYGSSFAPYAREIKKPLVGSVVVAVGGALRTLGTHFNVETTTGLVTFLAGSVPEAGQQVTAGFEFDVPARFDTDRLEVTVLSLKHGDVPSVPIVEIRL